MNDTDRNSIIAAARWLSQQSVSSNGAYDAPVDKRDLERLRNNVVKALLSIAEER